MIYAKDCKCCVCGKPAVAFWPVIDPDIPEHPYCRRCLDKAKIELLQKLTPIQGFPEPDFKFKVGDIVTWQCNGDYEITALKNVDGEPYYILGHQSEVAEDDLTLV